MLLRFRHLFFCCHFYWYRHRFIVRLNKPKDVFHIKFHNSFACENCCRINLHSFTSKINCLCVGGENFSLFFPFFFWKLSREVRNEIYGKFSCSFHINSTLKFCVETMMMITFCETGSSFFLWGAEWIFRWLRKFWRWFFGKGKGLFD